jgi:hypothetical protein
MSLFELHKRYSRAEIHKLLGGGSVRRYMIKLGGSIVASCLNPELHPRAPEEVYPGFGPIIEAEAALALAQPDPFHVFIKRGVHAFEYVGVYEAYATSTNRSEIEAAETLSNRKEENPISSILKLRKVSP